MARRFCYWVAGFAVWLLLTWSVDWQEIIAGAVVSFVAAAAFGGRLPIEPRKLLNPARWFWLLVYIPVFVYQCFKSNVDVALRVLSPGLQIKPGIVKIRTRLTSEVGRVFLANSITLTPGTMSVELTGDVLYIHWIEVGSDDPDTAARQIVGPFEYFLHRIFD